MDEKKEYVTLNGTHFTSWLRRGGKMLLEDETGYHKVEKSDKPGHYEVDSKGHHTLHGIKVWFGQYSAQYGEAVFSGYAVAKSDFSLWYTT